jgi:hypothetical protein
MANTVFYYELGTVNSELNSNKGATGFDGDTEVGSCMPRYHGAR